MDNDILDFIDNDDSKKDDIKCDFSKLIDFLKEEKIFDYKVSNSQLSFEIKRLKCFVVFKGSNFTVDFKCIDDVKIVKTIEGVIEEIKFKFDFIRNNKDSVDQILDLLCKLDTYGIRSHWSVLGGVDDKGDGGGVNLTITKNCKLLKKWSLT